MHLPRRVARWGAVLWSLSLVALLWWPTPDLPQAPSALPLDKFVHAGLFAGFAWLWMHAARGPHRRRAGRVAALGLLLAVLTEAGQGLLSFGRTPSLLDGLADAAGLALGAAAFAAGARVLEDDKTQSA